MPISEDGSEERTVLAEKDLGIDLGTWRLVQRTRMHVLVPGDLREPQSILYFERKFCSANGVETRELQHLHQRPFHPNVLQYYGKPQPERNASTLQVEYTEDSLEYAFPFFGLGAGRENLRRRDLPPVFLKRDRVLAVKCILRQVLSALLYYDEVLTRKHRSLRPEVCFFHRRTGLVKVGHFDVPSPTEVNGNRCVRFDLNQLARMAPEQRTMEYMERHIESENKWDSSKFDVWALGICCLQFLNGGKVPPKIQPSAMHMPTDRAVDAVFAMPENTTTATTATSAVGSGVTSSSTPEVSAVSAAQQQQQEELAVALNADPELRYVLRRCLSVDETKRPTVAEALAMTYVLRASSSSTSTASSSPNPNPAVEQRRDTSSVVPYGSDVWRLPMLPSPHVAAVTASVVAPPASSSPSSPPAIVVEEAENARQGQEEGSALAAAGAPVAVAGSRSTSRSKSINNNDGDDSSAERRHRHKDDEEEEGKAIKISPRNPKSSSNSSRTSTPRPLAAAAAVGDGNNSNNNNNNDDSLLEQTVDFGSTWRRPPVLDPQKNYSPRSTDQLLKESLAELKKADADIESCEATLYQCIINDFNTTSRQHHQQQGLGKEGNGGEKKEGSNGEQHQSKTGSCCGIVAAASEVQQQHYDDREEKIEESIHIAAKALKDEMQLWRAALFALPQLPDPRSRSAETAAKKSAIDRAMAHVLVDWRDKEVHLKLHQLCAWGIRTEVGYCVLIREKAQGHIKEGFAIWNVFRTVAAFVAQEIECIKFPL